MIKFKNILMPTDFSIGFNVALEFGIQLAKTTSGIIHIIHVIEPAVYPTDLGFSQVSFVDFNKEIEFNAANELKKICSKLDSENIENKSEILCGRASDQIIYYTEQNIIDVICIATHGRSGFEHLLFGSTTEKVLRKSHCPVLAIPISNEIN